METKTDNLISESPDTHKVFLTGPSVFKTSVERLSKKKKSRALLKYGIGIILAGAIGWAVGFCVGHIFLDTLEPDRLVSMEAIQYWHYLPLKFGHFGAVLAAATSIPVVYLLSLRRMRYQIQKDSNKGTNKHGDLGSATEASSAPMETLEWVKSNPTK